MLVIAQIVVSVILIVLILLQERGGGLGSLGGGESTPYHTRRGLEKSIFWATVVLAVLFAALAVLNLVLST